ncbi:TPA: hypothetical protein N0F65_000812 [Lagenidium giganteum]|uniref:Reverse transcriptase domain-containing protein n=1 Tax=Lagenidium giganteum TaxID=4803 RepID=A0AAV2YUA9_9STRA|nr:TPA: hypothetical protein N0F65_000812 [Lagenidium giganteum]
MDSSQLKLARLPSLSALTKLEEQPYEEFLNDLKRGDVAEVVLLRSEAELSETTVLDEEAIAAFKARFDARRGSAILKNPRDRYYDLVKRFSKTCLSADPPKGLAPERGVRHEIDLKPGSGYAVLRQWALPQEQSDFIDAFFEEKRRNGLPNGKWRIVHAYNKLNAATIPAQTPIPRKDVILHRMSGSKKYSALDMVDGYYQILMNDRDIPLTAVSTPSGMLWEWLVMPQGLSNAPATFNRLVPTFSGRCVRSHGRISTISTSTRSPSEVVIWIRSTLTICIRCWNAWKPTSCMPTWISVSSGQTKSPSSVATSVSTAFEQTQRRSRQSPNGPCLSP